jgi:hypothetical protein
VLANAAVAPLPVSPTHPESQWQDALDVNLTGVYNTVETAIPTLVKQGQGGAIVVTSSTSGNNGVGGNTPGALGYIAAKHGIVGLMRAYANYLAPSSIRVNSVHPTGVATPMLQNEPMQQFLRNDPIMSKREGNALPVPVIEPVDISNAILWLVCDEGRYVTGVLLPVDAGFANKKLAPCRILAHRYAGRRAWGNGAVLCRRVIGSRAYPRGLILASMFLGICSKVGMVVTSCSTRMGECSVLCWPIRVATLWRRRPGHEEGGGNSYE